MRRNAPDTEQPWTIEEVADFLRIPVQTLYQWRRKNVGPPAKKCGRHLRYSPSAVLAWLQSDAA